MGKVKDKQHRNFIDDLGMFLGSSDTLNDEPKLGDYRACKDTSLQIHDGKSWRDVNSNVGAIGLDFDTIYKEMIKRLSVVPTYEHKCHNCGGTLKIKKDQGIFKCPYCRSAYAIGTKQINAHY